MQHITSFNVLHLNRAAINILQDCSDFQREAISLLFVLDFLRVSSTCLFMIEIMLGLSLQIINDAQGKISKEYPWLIIPNYSDTAMVALMGKSIFDLIIKPRLKSFWKKNRTALFLSFMIELSREKIRGSWYLLQLLSKYFIFNYFLFSQTIMKLAYFNLGDWLSRCNNCSSSLHTSTLFLHKSTKQEMAPWDRLAS